MFIVQIMIIKHLVGKLEFEIEDDCYVFSEQQSRIFTKLFTI